MDLRVQVEAVTRTELIEGAAGSEPTARVADRVRLARERATARYAETPWRTNSEVPGHELRTRWQVGPAGLREAERDMERGLLTARGLDRVLRVAWTIADLAGAERPGPPEMAEALQLRTGISRGVPAVAGGGG
ncbi:putative ATPase with chaperone activity [Streptomyces sp. SPB162]|nr:putative ATPase with chaperone activity [Streptomyces sp. SPB162]